MAETVIRHSFCYEPLIPGSSEIRLLVLRAGEFSEPVQCELHNADLSQNPLYEALSYVWGDPAEKNSIHLCDHDFGVTRNLESALRHLRRPFSNRTLWIDAVCINQDDVDEKSEQVRRMTNIYRSAQTVLVWLGIGREPTDPDADDEQRFPWTSAEDSFAFARRLASQSSNEEWINFSNPEFVGMYVLLQRPWFQRLWVLQEFAVARNVEVICGTSHIPWHILEKASRQISKPQVNPTVEEQVTRSQSMSPLMRFEFCVRTITEQHKNLGSLADRLFELLSLVVCRQEVADPRDRLYGILGMCSESGSQLQDPRLAIDYSKPSAQVFRDLAKYLLEERRSLDVLCGHRDILDGCPSWVPTWGAPTGEPMLGRFSKGAKVMVTDPDTQAEFEFLMDDKVLRVKGVNIGKIAVVGSQANPTSTSTETPPIVQLRSLFLEWEEMILGCPYSKNKYQTTKQALEVWKLIVMYDLLRDDVAHEEKVMEFMLYEAIVGRMTIDNKGVEEFTNQLAWRRYRKLDGLYPIITRSGDMGLTDSGFKNQPRAGDCICLFQRGSVPFIVRESGLSHRFLGPCYLYGFMSKETQQNSFKETVANSFDLV